MSLGPTILFDKSFLQSLSVDEAVLFDHFFIPTISPLFYIETLADLEKVVRAGRTPEREVQIIAQKSPETSGVPLAYHEELAKLNLMGEEIPMNGRIPVTGGKAVEVEGRGGVVHDVPPEVEAFGRWQRAEFLEIEHGVAKAWRQSLESLDGGTILADVEKLGLNINLCKNLEEAKSLAESVVGDSTRKFDRMRLAASVVHSR